MRLLLTSQPIYSHLVPGLIPFARHAIAAGHEVAVATAASMAGELAALGVPHVALPGVAGQDELRTSPELARRYGLPQRLCAPGSRRILPGVPAQISRAYAGPIALRFAEELLRATDGFRPDLIVHEPSEYGGYLAAEVLGIPHVTLDVMPYQADELPLVAEVLDAGRVQLRLPSTPDPQHPRRYLSAAVIPRHWYPTHLRSPTLRHYRLPEPATTPASPGDPTVLASLGSLVLTLPNVAELLPVILEALSALPRRCVLTLGGQRQLADRLPEVPANVTVLPFVDQRAVLANCDLFLTHAGFNGILEAVTAAVPMVALPVVADQPANARRLAELGLGEWLDTESCSAATLAATCTRVLADPGYTRRLVDLRDQLRAAPDLDALLEDLGALCDRHDAAVHIGPTRR